MAEAGGHVGADGTYGHGEEKEEAVVVGEDGDEEEEPQFY